MVVYHGSLKDFNVFDNSKSRFGVGIYFSSSKEFATKFAGRNGVVKSFFLKIINPLYNGFDGAGVGSQMSFEHRDGGIFTKRQTDNYAKKGTKEYIVSEPNQIKLADGTNTTFDPNNDDIRFATGGTVLLAPNGKPSNLTTEQYKLVRTPEFKAWFGDWENDPENASKVVDENGEPMVLFHGTNRNFNVFNEKKIGLTDKGWYGYGYYFSPSTQMSDLYGKSKPYFIKIKKIFNTNKENPFYLGGKDVTENYITKGYEGASKTFDVNKLYHEYCVFFPFSNNIKLADGTNTTFDPNSDDIRFEEGGEIENELRVVTKKEEIIEYLTRNSGNWKERDINELEELFKTGQYIEQEENIIKEVSKEYYNFYSKNPLFKKIPLIIYENNIKMGFGEGELFRYDFLHNLFVLSSSKEYNNLKNISNVEINDNCIFVYQKYDNKVYGAFMHEYGHYVNSGKAIYLQEDWLINNYETISKYISIYAGENRVEFIAEVFALKNIPNYNELDYEKKKFIIQNYDNKIPIKNNFKKGGSISKTPAPLKERIYGSDRNKPRSSKDSSSAESIRFDAKTLSSIENKVEKHNEEHPDKKVNLGTAKAVVRRGMGAYSKSHRPTISGGQPNSRVAWGLARLNAFLYKVVHGVSKSGKYSQDNDLLDELGIAHKKFAGGGKIPKKSKGGDCYVVAGKIALNNRLPNEKNREFVGEPYVIHAQVTGQGAIAGLKYGHAWVEDSIYVYDYSNGRELKIPKAVYYKLGQVVEQQPIYFKYTFGEAKRKMAETGHFGSWDLITESGL
jgi:hypothetical protein